MTEDHFDKEIYIDRDTQPSKLVSCSQCKNKGKEILRECYDNPRHPLVCGFFEQK